MNERFWKIGTFASAIAAVILIVIGLLAGVSLHNTSAGAAPSPSAASSSASASSTPVSVPTADQQTLTRLTVDYRTPGFNCARAVKASGHKVVQGVYTYDVGVRHAVGKGKNHRKWSDALSVPLPGATPAAKRHSLEVAICRDPYVGSAWAHALGTLNVSGHKVSAMNPWLRPFADIHRVNDQAKRFGALLDPKAMKQSAKSAKHFVAVNRAWQKQANAIDGLLAQFDPTAIRALSSVRNWHALPLSGTLPEVVLNRQQESLPALVLSLTQKGACAPLLKIGVNVEDMRPEVFETPSCTTPRVVTRCVRNCTPPQGGCHAASCRPVTVCVRHCGVPGHKCPCVTTSEGSQSPLPPPVGPSGAPSTAPSAQPTKPVDTASPASPTPGGYNGGSPSQPGTTAPPSTMNPSPSATNTGDTGGF